MFKFTKNSDCLLIRSMSVILTALADLTRKITEILEVEFFQRVGFSGKRRMASFHKVVIFQKGIKTRVKHDRDDTELLKFAIRCFQPQQQLKEGNSKEFAQVNHRRQDCQHEVTSKSSA